MSKVVDLTGQIMFTKVLITAVLAATVMLSPAKAEPSFLEAALFFLTNVEAGGSDTITDSEIALSRYSLVAYLGPAEPNGRTCRVRLRNTATNQIWQMNFCKLHGYQYSQFGGGGFWVFEGDAEAWCTVTPKVNENYMGEMDKETWGDGDLPVACSKGGGLPGHKAVFAGGRGISEFIPLARSIGTSQQRVIDCFRYIMALLGAKPY
jgi:hypothetical protein